MTFFTFSRKLSTVVNRSKLFNVSTCRLQNCIKKYEGVFVWKIYREKSHNFSKKHKLPLIQVEDAFISYLEKSNGKMENIGLYFCNSGTPYYNAKSETSITQFVNTGEFSDSMYTQSQELIEKIVQNKITKYNNATETPFTPIPNVAPILLIDQLYNDASLTTNGHGIAEFQQMLTQARKLANGKKFYIKPHPKGQGYLANLTTNSEAVIISENCNIFNILPHVETVMVVSSQTGFEALLAKKSVYTFGSPFYAGYGLTIDNIPQTGRISSTLEKLFWASYVHSCRYFVAQIECNLDEILDVIIQHKKCVTIDSITKRYFLYKIPQWKVPSLMAFIFKKNPHFIKINNYKDVKKYNPTKNDAIIVWGFKGECEKIISFAMVNQIPLITFEDGFIRSTGLGSNFVSPSSFVLDRTGIYYNPQTESDLTTKLRTANINAQQRKRIQLLCNNLVEMKVSKYNLHNPSHQIHTIKEQADNRKIILITGQVSDDMSIIKGSTTVSQYTQLCETVRNKNPNAFIIYKHHPDVVAQNRKGYISSHILRRHVDCILTHENIIDVIKIADELHTITSLAGFEALLHGKKVFHYGLPFYGGYGFTEDKSAIIHNRPQIDLTTFCYQCLIEYPRYTNIGLYIALTPEIIIKQLTQQKYRHKQAPYITRKLMQLKNLINFYLRSII